MRQALSHQRMVPKLPAVLNIHPYLADCDAIQEVLVGRLGKVGHEGNLGGLGQ